VHGGLDVGVAHQLHQRRQADAGSHHIRGKCVPKTVWVGELDAGSAAMMAEQRA
jgi:hypothetical protein